MELLDAHLQGAEVILKHGLEEWPLFADEQPAK
jgi:hypothetical protein